MDYTVSPLLIWLACSTTSTATRHAAVPDRWCRPFFSECLRNAFYPALMDNLLLAAVLTRKNILKTYAIYRKGPKPPVERWERAQQRLPPFFPTEDGCMLVNTQEGTFGRRAGRSRGPKSHPPSVEKKAQRLPPFTATCW